MTIKRLIKELMAIEEEHKEEIWKLQVKIIELEDEIGYLNQRLEESTNEDIREYL